MDNPLRTFGVQTPFWTLGAAVSNRDALPDAQAHRFPEVSTKGALICTWCVSGKPVIDTGHSCGGEAETQMSVDMPTTF